MMISEYLLTLLRLAPTGDNSQQFRYKVQDDSLLIYHEALIAQHRFNQSQVASLLSLGMIVEIITTVANQNAAQVNFEYSKNFKQDHLWLKASFQEKNKLSISTEQNQRYLSLLQQRQTFRGFFKKANFDFEKFNKIFANRVTFCKMLSPNLKSLILKMENMIFDDYEAFTDIEKWFRYSEKSVVQTKTGMSLTNLNIDPLNGLLLKIVRKFHLVSILLRPYFKALNFLKVNVIYESSVGFGVVTMNGTDDQAIIQAGRTVLEVWLRLTELGMVLQPISSASLLPFEFVHRQAHFLKKYELALAGADQIIKNNFNYTNGPGIWLFRFGIPDKSVNKKNQRSLRLDVDQLLLKD